MREGRRRRSHGHWFRDSSAIGSTQAACSFRQLDRNLCYVGQFAHGFFGLGLNVMKCTPTGRPNRFSVSLAQTTDADERFNMRSWNKPVTVTLSLDKLWSAIEISRVPLGIPQLAAWVSKRGLRRKAIQYRQRGLVRALNRRGRHIPLAANFGRTSGPRLSYSALAFRFVIFGKDDYG
jgi:hypothetical protein